MQLRCQHYKTFFFITDAQGKLASICPCQYLQHTLMLAGEARSLPQRGEPERCSARKSRDHTSKYEISLEELDRDKRSSLFARNVSNEEKKFCKILR